MKKTAAVLMVALMACAPGQTLGGLKGLQQAALSDQSTECMIHEYTRRYNEVLRAFSHQKKEWSSGMDEQAHVEAMKWVNDVWMAADQRTVQNNLQSREFLSAVERFRASQRLQYPNLAVVR